MVAIVVWDVQGQGFDSTMAKRATAGRWPTWSESVPIALTSSLAPQESRDVPIPFIFTSSFFSDELEVRFLPPYEGAPAFDSNPDNDFKDMIPLYVQSGTTTDLEHCMSEVKTVQRMAIHLAILAFAGGLPAAQEDAITAGIIPEIISLNLTEMKLTLFRLLYTAGTTLRDLSAAYDQAVKEGKILEAAAMGAGVIAAIVGEILHKHVDLVLGLVKIFWYEFAGTGCLALLPSPSDAKALVSSLLQGFQEGLEAAAQEVFWFLAGSPIDLLVTDSARRRVAVRLNGTVESEISEAVAFRIDDASTSVIAIPRSDTCTLQVLGLDTGTARIGVIQPRLDGNVSTVIYEDVPQQQGSSNSAVVGPATTEYPLQIDLDGDGTTDESRVPSSIDVFSLPPVSPLVFVSTSLPDAEVGTPYSFKLEAMGGKPPYQFTLEAGTLPLELGLLGTGEIVGTPTAARDAAFTVKVEDLLGSSVVADLELQPSIADAISQLGADTSAAEIPQRNKNALLKLLENALKTLANGEEKLNAGKTKQAKTQFKAARSKIESYGKTLTRLKDKEKVLPAVADPLLVTATNIIARLDALIARL
ncbi:MAG: hypothetical protein HYZ72_04120 [Deltaproteobacteria bacterium]|nr:hypothetical protein [Deltaproteobacteria bacterium]